FLTCAAKKFGKPLRGFKVGVMEALQQYRWPGNIRELQNVMERAAILATGSSLDVEGLLPEPQVQTQQSVMLTLEDIECAHIRRVLEHTKGVIAGPKGAALVLGMHPNTLRSRMVKLGVAG
ncbi:helix-turn-helix domain-containing protein, partial [Pseudomonadota bacterium]